MIQVRRVSTVAGAREPVTADEFMQWARVTDDSERATADRLITVARIEVEQYTGHVLVPGTFAMTTRATLRVELPLTPVVSVDGVSTIDASGAVVVLDPAAYVSLLTVAPALLRITAPDYGTSGVEVLASAGYATPVDVPPDLKQAVMDVALLHYQHRDDPDLLERVRGYLAVLHQVFGFVQI